MGALPRNANARREEIQSVIGIKCVSVGFEAQAKLERWRLTTCKHNARTALDNSIA